MFQAGLGRVQITPPLSAPHAGWGAQTHVYPDGVDADLWATVLLLDDGMQTIALVELDLVIVTRDESDAIRAAITELLDIPTTHVRVSVTHNHAGPPPSSWNWMPAGTAALQAYYALLPSLISGAALLASRNMQAARIGVDTGTSRVAVNRRETAPGGRTITGVDPEGPIDPQVLVARIETTDGAPIAAIAGYTMHPTTMGPGNRLVSPDWPGHMKRTVESLTGAPCLFMQGATGDIGPGPEGYTDDIQVVRRIGTLIGCEVARVWHSMQVPAVQFVHNTIQESGAPLGIWKKVPCEEQPVQLAARSAWVSLPVRPQPPLKSAEADADAAVRHLHQLTHNSAPDDELEDAMFRVKRANMTLSKVRTFGGSSTFAIELHGVRVGPLLLIGCEGEPFSAIGTSIKSQSLFAYTWFGGYTGGWLGYIPTPEEFARNGYEVDTSPYTDAAAAALVAETVSFMQEFAGASATARQE